MREGFSALCLRQEVRDVDFVVVPRGLKICDPSIVGNVMSTWCDLYVYKQLVGLIMP